MPKAAQKAGFSDESGSAENVSKIGEAREREAFTRGAWVGRPQMGVYLCSMAASVLAPLRASHDPISKPLNGMRTRGAAGGVLRKGADQRPLNLASGQRRKAESVGFCLSANNIKLKPSDQLALIQAEPGLAGAAVVPEDAVVPTLMA